MNIGYTLLQHYLIETAKRLPEKCAVICEKHKYTYDEIQRLSDQLAAALIQFGVQRGDRVVIKLGNSINTIIAFWAVLKADAIVSIIGDDSKIDKLLFILKDSGARIYITSLVEEMLFNRVLEECPKLATILFNQKIEQDNNTRISIISLPKILYNHTQKFQRKPQNISSDIASIIYTSGSTGEPRGVMVTHRNMLVATISINQYLGNVEDDVIISALPLSFDYGLYQMILAFSVGATLILEKDFVWPNLFLENIIKYNVTVVPCVPSMVTLLGEYIKHFAYDLSKVRYVSSTGAALLPKHIEIFKKLFPFAQIYSMYGLTECKRCTYLPPKDINRKPNSIGIAIPNTELWVVDEDGNKVGPGKVGQLVIRGETVMKGYWNKPEETAKKLKDGLLPFEKVLYTGDYVELDEDGYLYFHGRMDEVIKSRGIKVSPKEIEDVIVSIPEVKEVVILGVESEQYGSEICAVISLLHGIKIAETDIMAKCKEKLEKGKVPTKIYIVPNIPKNSNGKYDKQLLKVRIKEKLLINKRGEMYNAIP